MDPKVEQCPLCKSLQIRAFKAVPNDAPEDNATLLLNECSDCGLAWQFPRQRPFSASVQHHTAKYAEQQTNSYFDPAKRKAIAAAEIAFLGECVAQPSALLDVGSGDGTFVSLAAEYGWSCIGVDPAGRTEAKNHLSNGGSWQCIRGTMESLPINAKFDVITMWDVIEHLEDPEPIIFNSRSHLNDNGILVLETGNYQSTARILGRERWWGYAFDHRWYFSPPTLKLLLLQCGYRHIFYCKRTLRPWWNGSHLYAGPSYIGTLRSIIRSPLSTPTLLRTHRQLAGAATAYPNWAGLGIITLVASMKPLHCALENNDLLEI